MKKLIAVAMVMCALFATSTVTMAQNCKKETKKECTKKEKKEKKGECKKEAKTSCCAKDKK